MYQIVYYMYLSKGHDFAGEKKLLGFASFLLRRLEHNQVVMHCTRKEVKLRQPISARRYTYVAATSWSVRHCYHCCHLLTLSALRQVSSAEIRTCYVLFTYAFSTNLKNIVTLSLNSLDSDKHPRKSASYLD